MKYLLQREAVGQPIPESASAVYAQNDVYRKYIQNLDVIVSLYNRLVRGNGLFLYFLCLLNCVSVRDEVLAVEYPLIEDTLGVIDQQMERALAELNWTSSGELFGSCVTSSLSVCIYNATTYVLDHDYYLFYV